VENKNQTSELGKLVDKQNGSGKIEEGAGQESLFGSIISGDKEQVLSVKDTDFSIVIPKIGASEKVIANVDPGVEKEYKKSLLEGVAHAKGSSLPGLNGSTYIFAHSADSFWNVGRYNAVFYLLKELKPGDEIIIVFQGKRFNYKVTETKIVDPSEVSYLEAKIGQGEQLILQTCWPPGTTFKRLLVFAKPE
jgi:LPXTG-site transpeptidase (sortase) family protein